MNENEKRELIRYQQLFISVLNTTLEGHYTVEEIFSGLSGLLTKAGYCIFPSREIFVTVMSKMWDAVAEAESQNRSTHIN